MIIRWTRNGPFLDLNTDNDDDDVIIIIKLRLLGVVIELLRNYTLLYNVPLPAHHGRLIKTGC